MTSDNTRRDAKTWVDVGRALWELFKALVYMLASFAALASFMVFIVAWQLNWPLRELIGWATLTIVLAMPRERRSDD